MSRTIDLALDLDVYRRNAFRVTGLPVDAGPRAIRRRRREHELGTPANTAPGTLALAAPPTTTELNAAFARLDDPRTRIVDELTWLWRGDDGGSVAGAGEASLTAHDRAVRAHCRALDLEAQSGDLAPATVQERDGAWDEAMRAWRQVARDETVWNVLARRAADLDDPRLDQDAVRGMSSRVVGALLDVSARLAVEDARAGRSPARHRRAMLVLTGDATTPVDDAVRRAAAPLVGRVDEACGVAYAAARDVPVARSLHAATTGPLEALGALLPRTDPTYQRIADTVAGLLRQTAVRVFNEAVTPRGPGGPVDHVRVQAVLPDCLDLLVHARAVVVGADTRAAVDRDLDVVRDRERTVAGEARGQRRSVGGRVATTVALGVAAVLLPTGLGFIAAFFFVRSGFLLAPRTAGPGLVRGGTLALLAVYVGWPLTPIPVLIAIALLTAAGIFAGADAVDDHRWQGAALAVGGTAFIVVALAASSEPWLATLGVVAVAVAANIVGVREGELWLGLLLVLVLGLMTVAAGIWAEGSVVGIVIGGLLAGYGGLALLRRSA